jgi:hypothetical protein
LPGSGRAVHLHAFHAADGPQRHDHPWALLSIVLRGGYIEETMR